MPTFFKCGSEYDNGDDSCNYWNVENVCLMRFLHDNESNRVNFYYKSCLLCYNIRGCS